MYFFARYYRRRCSSSPR